jgi:hypothetical protein
VKREALHVVHAETQLRALEAVRHVADEYGLATARLKPCVAFLLDGNIGGAQRHQAAFTIAIDCRRMGLSERETGEVLSRWAKKIGHRVREALDPIRSAYAKNPDGSWKYHPPGVSKRHGSNYDQVLGDICRDVGCPSNCAPFKDLSRGPRGEDFPQFERLDWPLVLRKQRHPAAIDWYKAICFLERRHRFAAGAEILTSYAQLAEIAGRDKRHAGENLRILQTRGLLSVFERGSGSGPKARDRRPSCVARAVPIPNIPPRYRGAITTGGGSPPEIGGERPPQIDGASPPHIGGAHWKPDS